MTTIQKKLCYFVGIAFTMLIVLFAYSLFFGKLFPYAPIIIGFSKNQLEHSVVYVQHGAASADFGLIDSLLPDVAAFHELGFIKKPRIFIFKDDEGYTRRSISKARFCAFYNGDIVISPWAMREAERGEISLEIYLKHELSHALLHQHSGLLRAYRYPAWLLEGIAMYSAKQMGTTWYPSKEKTYEYIRNGNFMPPEFFKTRREDQVVLNVEHRIPFIYSEFACIVDYLIDRYGKGKLLASMKELNDGGSFDEVFQDVYGIDFSDCLEAFQASVRQI